MNEDTPQKRAKVYRENKRLRQKIKTLKRVSDEWRKKYERLREEVEKNKPPNPITMVKQFINNRSIPKDVEDKLVEHAVLEAQLENTFKAQKSYKDKDILRRILCGQIIKKYRKITYMQRFAPRRFMDGNRPFASNLQYRKFSHAPRIPGLKEDIINFLEKDCNSRMTSEKKEVIKKNGEEKQKRYLLKTMEDLHTEFLKSVPYKIGKTLFCKFRPFWILFPSCDKRETCACTKHENFALIIQKLKIEKVLEVKSPREVLQKLTCNESEACMLGKCDECKNRQITLLPHNSQKEVTYYQFQTIQEEKVYEKKQKKKSTDGGPDTIEIVQVKKKHQRTVKRDLSCTLEELVQKMKSSLPSFMKHVHNMNHQFKALSGKRSTLTNDEAYLWVDFSENWSTKMARETQGVHFGASREQYTLHTGMAYWTDSKQSYCTLSDDNDHGPPQIMAHLQPVITSILETPMETPTVLHFQSDSPVTQYRGKAMFAYLAQVLPNLFPGLQSFTWNYTEAGHGKGPVDGVGVAVKLHADRQVAMNNDIKDYKTFVEHATKMKTVKVEAINKDSIKEMKTTEINVKKFVGTMDMHQLTWTRSNPGVLHFNSLSCFTCSPGTKCGHYAMGTLNYRSQIDHEQYSNEQEQAVDDVLEIPEVTLHNVRPGKEISTNDWVVLTLSGQRYPG